MITKNTMDVLDSLFFARFVSPKHYVIVLRAGDGVEYELDYATPELVETKLAEWKSRAGKLFFDMP